MYRRTGTVWWGCAHRTPGLPRTLVLVFTMHFTIPPHLLFEDKSWSSLKRLQGQERSHRTSVSFVGLGPRKFHSSALELGDQSLWTDTPADRARKVLCNYLSCLGSSANIIKYICWRLSFKNYCGTFRLLCNYNKIYRMQFHKKINPCNNMAGCKFTWSTIKFTLEVHCIRAYW